MQSASRIRRLAILLAFLTMALASQSEARIFRRIFFPSRSNFVQPTFRRFPSQSQFVTQASPPLASSDSLAAPAPGGGSGDAASGDHSDTSLSDEFSPSGRRYLSNGQWRSFIPLSSNVTAVNGVPVPPGPRPIGYRFGPNGELQWVSSQRTPNSPTPGTNPGAGTTPGQNPVPPPNPGPSNGPTPGGHDHGTNPNPGTPPPTGGQTPRQRALANPIVQATLDKCIACHSMYTTTPPSNLLTREALTHAMRTGEGGTYQRKIHDMMGARAEARHIHFTADEIRAIADVYFTTPGESDPGPAPVTQPEISAQERSYPTNSERARALQNPVATQALMRCLVCHNDPNTRNTGEVNTLSKLRAAMRTIDEGTITSMIQRGYQHPRMIHIQDITRREDFANNPVRLETVLREIARLPQDQPISSTGGTQ